MTSHGLSEKDFQQRIMQAAGLYGWRCAHFRPARTVQGWRTPMQGDVGVPDLILARDGRVLLAELKSDRGRPTPDQELWLEAAGDHGRLWRPADWIKINSELLRRHR